MKEDGKVGDEIGGLLNRLLFSGEREREREREGTMKMGSLFLSSLNLHTDIMHVLC